MHRPGLFSFREYRRLPISISKVDPRDLFEVAA
jgi:hypothetical protein